MVLIVLKMALGGRLCLDGVTLYRRALNSSVTLATFVYWQSSRTTQPTCGQFALQFGRRL